MYVAVLDNLLLEFSIKLKALPTRTGAHQVIKQFSVSVGGSANTIIVGQRLGIPMYPIGAVGADQYGAQVISMLQEEGINTDNVQIGGSDHTTTVFTLVEESGDYTFLSYSRGKGPQSLPKNWKKTIQDSKGMFLSGWTYENMYPQVVSTAVKVAYKLGLPIFFDPGPSYASMPHTWLKSILSMTTVLLVTEEEAYGLLGLIDKGGELDEALMMLHNTGASLIVIKRGANGVVISNGEKIERHAGFVVDANDKTGAGDALAATVILSYLQNYSLTEMAVLADATGAAAVQKVGTGQHLPQKDEIRAILENSIDSSYASLSFASNQNCDL